jgi:ribosomal protein S18 acetylase RimI-like enzyme
MKIDIRQAGVEDAALIAELSRQTFIDTFAAQNTKENMEIFLTEQFSRDALIQEVEDIANIFLLATVGESVVGYAKIREGKQIPELQGLPAMEIARIYATRDAIGKGVGSALMNRCIELASERQRKVIWLGVWEHNLSAIEFYQRWGFEKFSEHDFALGKDIQRDWLMKKSLNP